MSSSKKPVWSDSAVLFHRLLSSVGRSILLGDPDQDTLRLYGRIPAARKPIRENLRAAFRQIMVRVDATPARGERPALYFVYSGHGDVKNNEGLLALDDGVFTSRDLETLVPKRSRAV